MTGFGERSFQYGLCQHISHLGWQLTLDDDELGRDSGEVIRFNELQAALIRLNPEIVEKPARAEEVLQKLRPVLLSAPNDGLLAANEEFHAWLCGRRTILYVGATHHAALKLIDFDNPRSNDLRITAEATFNAGRDRRYDIVLWVNGIPLVVGETKAPKDNLTWLTAATDIHNGYEKKTPAFFAPNVFSFATDGRELRYGAIGQSPEFWLEWSKTTDPTMSQGLARVNRSAELLLTPEMVLNILKYFTLYSSRPTSEGALRKKIIPRYPQVEAVEAIIERCLDPNKRQGLVWHHQGSGKTFAMAYAASKLRHETDMKAPTIVVVLDRLDLIQQTTAEFESIGIEGLNVAETKEELQQLLSEDSREVIITTIYRFEGAGPLNERDNIVVLVDEAHRTQEGRLGQDMRVALPRAKFIGLTGTPIATSDKNTWELFGDQDDPDGVLNHYSVERSIYDGATLPVHVETRLVDFHFDSETIEEEFNAMSEEEGLDDEQRELLARKAGHFSVVVQNKQRVKAVCQDIVEHYRTRIAPLGLKAQIVAYNRAACVEYLKEIQALLRDGEEAMIVMTTKKDDPEGWSQWDLDRHQEAHIKSRFRDCEDPLKFLIVTAKLLTGFDAPIEGVMYLDKPLRAHTLFQAVCRTNRRWTHPNTGQEKHFGLVVDYVGMGQQLAKAVSVKPTDVAKTSEADLEVLLEENIKAIEIAYERFADIDLALPGYERIWAAQQILSEEGGRANEQFAEEFLKCQGLFEFLYPDLRLRAHEVSYKFLADVYRACKPSNAPNQLLWQRLGAKTMRIVHENLTGVAIDGSALDQVLLDSDSLEYLKDNDLLAELLLIPESDTARPPPDAAEVIDRLEGRIRRRMEGSDPHRVWRTLSERLEALREAKLATAEASVEFLKNLMEVAQEVVRAERADEEGALDEFKVLGPNQRALTMIFQEYAPGNSPVFVENVVIEVDAMVEPSANTGWQNSHPGDQRVRQELRKTLRKYQLPPDGELFSRAYNYIREHY